MNSIRYTVKANCLFNVGLNLVLNGCYHCVCQTKSLNVLCINAAVCRIIQNLRLEGAVVCKKKTTIARFWMDLERERVDNYSSKLRRLFYGNQVA